MKIERIFNYRNVWMGLAALWIIWFHSGILLPSEALNYIKSLGYGGVDIFLFASGVGCYYSLNKESDSIHFLKRRFMRIMPTYWCVIVVWLLYKTQTQGMPFTAVVGNLLCIQTFTGQGYEFEWYTGTICLFYVLAPLLAQIVDRIRNWKQCAIVVLFLVLFSIPFWGSLDLIIVITRIPVFFLGMYFAKLGRQGGCLSGKMLLILITLMFIGIGLLLYFGTYFKDYLWWWGLDWYPFILIVPGLCVTISYIMEKLGDNLIKKGMETILGFIGKHSFEIYLVQLFIFDIYGTCFVATGVIPNRIRYQLCAIALIVPGCVILNLFKKGAVKVVTWIYDKGKNVDKALVGEKR